MAWIVWSVGRLLLSMLPVGVLAGSKAAQPTQNTDPWAQATAGNKGNGMHKQNLFFICTLTVQVYYLCFPSFLIVKPFI